MARRQRDWAARKRRELIALLGGECQDPLCKSGEQLQIHHVDGRDWEVTVKDQSARVSRYFAEYRQGARLGVLCKKCNGAARNNPRRPIPNTEGDLF